MSMRKFAVFDIDGTLARTSLFLQIVHELIDQGILPPEEGHKLEVKQQEYRKRAHNKAFNDYSLQSVDILFDNLEKISIEDYQSAVDSVISKTESLVYVYTRNLIEKLKTQKYFLIALSGSEMYSVQKFTEPYGFDIAIGERYHTKNNHFTGKFDKVIDNKEFYLNKLVDKYSLDIKDSIGIGDSSGDFGMLNFVENPIAFNPEEKLYNHARKNNWKIVVERKNVIYELENKDGKHILA
jgi:HAD superfamily hydrolase (TIGR01490 family)